ncbi:MAG: SDR family oxidoreductase [Hoeflea sp.]|uniref:SDR family oxidoreductase n=1 Tax=Hoeflea sp. TaxID=1940281 RepID=UPI001D313F5A|nr:SDR family oxidoreductase [Hoeflea sp.]MBU4527336.1 SDR family oxidoreductase [Alphaproteobacteria bacterium]MBU4546881.1 SDR family oxidoreductase [Alphaproteobacteria bacterium]MBU4551607.1 SDR family oxidoreductase [Alphaproteobacteria bacterium]MBV1725612.1 SDR family oxidoreductase [Hoeflea sp.]MBV1759660.1 SDR family oxidoreductase [Hoeflea sp.]
MSINLSGKTALITGASRGIGEAAARIMAGYGANVVLAARSTRDTARIAADIGDRALAVTCDVAQYVDVENAVNQAIESFGSLDILVNNAGVIDPIARIEDSDPEAWDQVVDINFKGVYHGLRAAIPVMKRQGGGVIINISSGAASSALEGWSHYCATKAAVLSLTRCAHAECAADNIRVVGLSPGTVATDMQRAIKDSGVNPVSQLDWSQHISPDWVGEAIAWLTTDAARTYDGDDMSLRTEEARRAVGLIA